MKMLIETKTFITVVKRRKQSHLLIFILINSNCNKYCAVQYTYSFIVVSPSSFVLGH